MYKTFLNKFNIYITLVFIFISIIGTSILYLNKGLHNYYESYKLTIPYITLLESANHIKAKEVPLMTNFEFNDYIGSSDDTHKACPKFNKNVRISVWEARNDIDFRVEIQYPDQNILQNCINEIFKLVEKKRLNEIKKLEKVNEFNLEIFRESVKKVIENNDFKIFMDFVNESVVTLEENNKTLKEDTANQLDSVTNIDEVFLNQLINPPPFRNNFLTGYIYNFLENYKILQYNKNMKEPQLRKISESHFLKKNILKFNMAIFFVFVISLILINLKKIRNTL